MLFSIIFPFSISHFISGGRTSAAVRRKEQNDRKKDSTDHVGNTGKKQAVAGNARTPGPHGY